MTAARTVRAAVRNVPVPPGQVVGIALAMILGRSFRIAPPGPRVLRAIAGGTLTGTGAALISWAMHERDARANGAFELERPDALVTTGPYALSRHPMYVGWWLVHLGVGVLGGSLWVLVSAPLAIVAEHPMVLAEERRLESRFPAGAAEYFARTHRYLPFPPLRRTGRRRSP